MFDIADFSLSANTTRGIAFLTDSGMSYTNGNSSNQSASDGTLKLSGGGCGYNGPFSGINFSLRIVSGSVTYTQVPAPATFALFSIGLIGLVSRRFKKQA